MWRHGRSYEKEFINQIVYDENIVFSIAAEKDDETFLSMNYGSYIPLGKQKKKIVSRDTRFDVGSVTKTVTSALTVKLAEEKKLDLDDYVRKYLPEYRYSDVKIINLLTHTAGYVSQKVRWPETDSDNKRYFKEIYSLNKKEREGVYREYTTFLYSLVMEIVQKVSDMDLQSYAEKTLFSKINMDKTTYHPNCINLENIVFPFDCKTKEYDYELIDYPPTGDTGLYTTAEDLLKFTGMFHADENNSPKIFKKESMKLMKREIAGHFNTTPTFWYKGDADNYSCFPDLSSKNTLAHPGYTGCIVCIDPDSNLSYAVLTNNKTFHEDFTNYKRVGNMIMKYANHQ